MQIIITCEECGRRHRLERSIDEPRCIWIVCHDCEMSLCAVLDAPALAQSTAGRLPDSQSFGDAWAGRLDLSTSR